MVHSGRQWSSGESHTLTCWSMEGPEEDNPLFCGSMWTLEAVLSAATMFVMMEGVWLTICVRRRLWRHAMVWEYYGIRVTIQIVQ
jgi:hypothetical protein